MEKKQYKQYINGLKGMACILIMLGHYLGLYKYAQQFTPRFPLLDTLLSSPLSFLFDEGYWLYLFFVISGYLVAQSMIGSIKQIVHKSIGRFFRFGFPILFSYLVIYIIYCFCGFHATDTLELFQCDWFQKYYSGSYSIFDVIIGPIKVLVLGESTLNSPYWVLQKMLIASMLIYIIRYLCNKTYELHPSLCFSVLILITCVSIVISQIITACLIGMLIALYERGQFLQNTVLPFWTIACAMMLYVLPKSIIASLFFASMIIFIPKVRWINTIFSSALFQFLGRISWGIYSFHWPVICSIAGIMIILSSQIGLQIAYIIVCIIATCITVIISVAYYYSFERISIKLSKSVGSLIQKILHE